MITAESVTGFNQFSALREILRQAISTPWLAIIVALNIFLTGFLTPTQNFGHNFTSHSQDLVSSFGVLLSLYISRHWIPSLSATFILASALPSALLFLTSKALYGNHIPVDLNSQIWPSALGVFGQLFAYSLLIGSFRYARTTRRLVAESIQKLIHTARELKETLARESERLQKMVRDEIEPELLNIQSEFLSGKNRSSILNAVTELIDNTIRPVSSRIDSQAEKLELYELDSRARKGKLPKQSLRERFRRQTPLSLASTPALSGFALLYFVIPNFLYFGNTKILFPFATVWFGCSLALLLSVQYFGRSRKRTLIFVIASAALLSIAEMAIFLLLNSIEKPGGIQGEIVGLCIVIFAIVFGGSLFELFLYSIERNFFEITATNNQLTIALSDAKRSHWYLGKRMAREIHGGLQARLHAFTLKLSSGEATAESFDKFFSDLNDITEIDRYVDARSNFQEFFHQTSELWAGMVTIQNSINADVISVLQDRAVLSEAILEVTREAINNAIKHGKAKSVSITLEKISDSELRLLVINEAINADKKAATNASLGTKIYDELTSTWDLIINHSKAHLTAQFLFE